MIAELNPALIMMLGALLIPLTRGLFRKVYLVGLPVICLLQLLQMPHGEFGHLAVFGLDLVTGRLDALSFVWALIFHIAAILAMIYALHVEDTLQHVTGLLYAGSAIGAVLAGDLITLFVYWEITALSSVFLIWARRTEKAYRVGMRYLIIQITSGVVLLAGAVLWFQDTGSITFGHLGTESLAGKIMLLAFGIKCAFPFLHNWLQDAYPEATVTGTVILSAFTTKLAVYTLARGFAGTELLIWVGAIMTAFPIFYAVIENDLRRVLSYSLNNQLGFMVVGVGLGTHLALNGTAAHAFCHILYKSLLFMSMGAVLYRTGTVKASELGGLYKSMPITAVCCMIGAASISALPLFSGFVSKSMIVSAASHEHLFPLFLVLLFASAGVVDHSGIKVPFFSFFAHDSGIRCKEAPRNMLVAMIITAALCIGIGVVPGPLYHILPYHDTHFTPYSAAHVVGQFQLLFFAALAFIFLMRKGIYPPEIPSTNLDSDWVYRKALPGRLKTAWACILREKERSDRSIVAVIRKIAIRLSQAAGPYSRYANSQSTSSMVFWVAVMLAVVLFFFFL